MRKKVGFLVRPGFACAYVARCLGSLAHQIAYLLMCILDEALQSLHLSFRGRLVNVGFTLVAQSQTPHLGSQA
jgi:hypothetical protein